MEPMGSVDVYGDGCYKGLWEISIRKQQRMENQQETELFGRMSQTGPKKCFIPQNCEKYTNFD